MTSGREISSASFAPGSGARMSVEPTSIAVGAGELGGGALGAGGDRRLGDDDPVARRLREQAELLVAGRSRRWRGRVR